MKKIILYVALLIALKPLDLFGQTIIVAGGSGSGGGSGTVSSVDVSVVAPLAISGGPVTSTGTIAIDWTSCAAHSVLAAPSGASGKPTCRLLVASDVPTIAPSQVTGTAVITTDSRLSDSRTPTAHASTHASAGSDPVTLAESQVTNLASDLAAKESTTAHNADVSTINTSLAGKVPTSTTVCGHALSANVACTASDVGLGSVPNVDATNAANIASGTLPAGRLPALTGDITTSAGSAATTLKNTGTAGTYGDATHTLTVTTDAQGRVSSVTTNAISSSVAWGSITGTLSSQTDLNSALAAKAPTSAPTFTNTTTFDVGAKVALPSALDYATPPLTFTGDTGVGISHRSSGQWSLVSSGERARITSTTFETESAGLVQAFINGVTLNVNYTHETLTLSTSGTTTNTTANLAPATVRIKYIVYRVLTTITGATDWSVKVAGGNNFVALGTATTAQTTLTSGSSGILVPTAYADQFNGAAAKLTVTTTGTPTAGSIHFYVLYEIAGLPSS